MTEANPTDHRSKGLSITFTIKPVVGLMLALAIALGAGYIYWTHTPQYSLLQAKAAFKAHDLPTFERYVDIDTVVNSAVDDVFNQAMAETQAAQAVATDNPWNKLGQQMAVGIVAMLKPAVANAAKEGIRNAFKTEQSAAEAEQAGPSFKSAEEEFKKKDLKFAGIEYIKHEGDSTLAGLRFTRGSDSQAPVIVELEMRRSEGHWRVHRWSNIVQTLKELGMTNPASAPSQSR